MDKRSPSKILDPKRLEQMMVVHKEFCNARIMEVDMQVGLHATTRRIRGRRLIGISRAYQMRDLPLGLILLQSKTSNLNINLILKSLTNRI